MALNPGYKQTEIGVLPQEWEVASVGEQAEKVGSGITPTGGERVYATDGRKFIRSQNVGWGTLILDDVAFIDETIHATFAATEIEIGDVLLNITGASIGRSAVADHRVRGGNVNQHVCILRGNPKQLIPSFLNYVLLSAEGQRQIDSFQAGGNRQGLNFAQVRSLRLPLPPLSEQGTITTALGDVDALLDGLTRLIAKKRDLKQAAMQQLLTGQTRLPGFRGLWEISTVGGEFEIMLGKMLDAERNVGVSKPYVGNRAVQWGRIDITEVQTVPMSRGDMQRYRLQKGDLLVCEGGEVGRAAIWDGSLEECYYQKALHRLRPVQGFNPLLMAAFLRHWSERGVFANYVTQTSFAHLPREKFITMPLPVPSKHEQEAISAVLSDMDAEIAALEARRDKTRLLKQAMMQELLTGRTRLV